MEPTKSQHKDSRLKGIDVSMQQSILDSFQRVIKMSTTFCGVLFEDKHHSLDKKTMDEIQEENMVKLILMEVSIV